MKKGKRKSKRRKKRKKQRKKRKNRRNQRKSVKRNVKKWKRQGRVTHPNQLGLIILQTQVRTTLTKLSSKTKQRLKIIQVKLVRLKQQPDFDRQEGIQNKSRLKVSQSKQFSFTEYRVIRSFKNSFKANSMNLKLSFTKI